MTPFGPASMPAASRFSPSTLGRRPAATSRWLASTTLSAPSPAAITTAIRLPRRSTRRTSTFSRRSTPSARSVRRTTATASGSSLGRMEPFWSTVTGVPRRRWAWASSQPIGPPPSTTRCSGRSPRSKIVSLVRKGTSSRPGTGGTAAREPVASTARRGRIVTPPASIARSPVKRACALTTVTPRPSKRSTLSCGAMPAITPRTCSRTFRKSTSGSWPLTPNAAGGADGVRRVRGREQRLGGDAAVVQAVAAHPAPLDQDDRGAHLHRARGHAEAA